MDVAQVGNRIRQRREQVGLRQRDIADALQLSAQAVSKWERGENAPDIGILPDLARLLGITTDWLLAGFDSVTRSSCTGICRSRSQTMHFSR